MSSASSGYGYSAYTGPYATVRGRSVPEADAISSPALDAVTRYVMSLRPSRSSPVALNIAIPAPRSSSQYDVMYPGRSSGSVHMGTWQSCVASSRRSLSRTMSKWRVLLRSFFHFMYGTCWIV